MTIDELESKHFNIPDQCYRGSEKHTKISIEFVISVLEEMKYNGDYPDGSTEYLNLTLKSKIEELKNQIK
jgi:hypothetical protein